MWLPCVIAELFTKLWYALLCRADLALSDKNGNFLGVKKPKEKTRTRRQDDIVYAGKPFWGRIMSAVLAASFVLMFVPELGISIDVSAAAVSDFPVTVDGNVVPYVSIDNSISNHVLFLKSEYLTADSYGISDFKYKIGYGKISLSWKLNASIDARLVSGYRVIIKCGNTEIYNKVESFNTLEVDEFVPDINSANTIDTDCRVSVYPITKIHKWDYYVEEDDVGNKIEMVSEESSPSYPYESSTGINEQSVGKLDATFDPPNLTIKNEKGEDITEYTGGSVSLNWNQVKQKGGTDAGVSSPDGYVVYIYDMSTGRITEKPAIQSKDDPVTYTLELKDIVKGHHYRFFVEAYRNVWGKPGYDKRNDGIISSSKENVSSDGNTKYTMVYSGVAKDLYVAPDRPSLLVTVNKTNIANREIALSWTDNSKIYEGVHIYRTNKEIKGVPEIDNGSVSLTDWIIDHYENNSGGDYGLTRVGVYAKTPTSDVDTTVAEGVQYYYYAIAYIRNGNDMPLYGSPAIAPGKLELDLGRTTLRANKGDGRVDLNWDSVDGADGYEIEIIQNSKYNKTTGRVDPLNPPVVIRKDYDLGNVTSFSHLDLYNDEQYTYRVRPYIWIETSTGTRPFYGNKGDGYCDPRTVTVGLGLETPVITEVDGKKDGQVTIKWDAVDGASYYILYYRNTSEEDFDEVSTDFKQIQTKKTTYTQTNLHNEDVYEYYVVAYKTVNLDGSDGAQTIDSDPSEHATVKVGTALNTPQNIKAVTADGQITISWDSVDGAEGYLLHYKYIDKNGVTHDYSDERVFDVVKSPYVHSGLQNGERYTYKVEAYKEPNGKRVSSPMSNEVWAIVGVPLDAPKDFTGTTKDGIVDLKWSDVKSAEGYILYFRKNGGAWEEVDVSKPGFQHVGLNNGDRYEYYVKAYKTVNGERVFSSGESNHLNFKIGDDLESPKDFSAVTTDGQVSLTWTAVKDAEGYIVYAYGAGRSYQFDVSKPGYVHTGLMNGDSWTYYVVAYKTVNGTRVYSSPTKSITVTTGVSLNSVIDLTATAGNRQVDLSWTAVKGAEGYVVYLYNSRTMEFEPITVISGTKYSHTGLKNGQKYTYMVAPYKTINGERFYGEYSMAVSATPSTGSNTDIDSTLTVRGTTPYGISHSEYITANANHGAFDEPVDVYFTTNRESTEAVKDVLKNYAGGLSSFIIYPFDISIYRENTKIEVDPNPGYSVTITMPIPDRLIAYRDYITVVHIGDGMQNTEEISATDTAEDWIRTADTTLEVLPCAIVDIDNIWCVQFVCSSFSPYALVIYKDHISDVSSGGGIIDGDFAGSFNSGVLLFTALPDIMPHNKKLRVVQGGKKRYRIKYIEKR